MRFGSPVERERFLDRIINFGHRYTLQFTKHDVGVHVRDHDLDREVWLMLMLFPNDARNNSAIAKAVAGFGLLRYWYDSTNNARVVCKVHLHNESVIPDDVVVTAGIDPKVRSWTYPVFVLKRKGIEVLGDEDLSPLADGGLAHPFPPPLPRWMGMDGPNPVHAPVSEQHEASDSAMGPRNDNQSVADMLNSCEHGAIGEQLSDPDVNIEEIAEPVEVVVGKTVEPVAVPEIGNVVVSRASLHNTLVSGGSRSIPSIPPGFESQVAVKVIHSLQSYPLLPACPSMPMFRHIKHLLFPLDTMVPPFITDVDVLKFLASIIFDPLEQAKCPVGMIGPLQLLHPLVPYPDSDEEEVDNVVIIPSLPSSSTPRKRRHRKLKVPLDDAFLRRSKRLSRDHGFRSVGLALEASNNPSMYAASTMDANVVAPHLPIDTIQAIAIGYLKI